MPLHTYWILLLSMVAINLRAAHANQYSPNTNQEFVQNPEENRGFKEGDIVPLPLTKTLLERGVAIRPADQRWPGGVVPYEIASNISAKNATFIVSMMRTIENLTQVNNTLCVKFRPRNTFDPYYITIFNGSGCYAPVGSWSNYTGVRPVSFFHGSRATCMVTGIIQHELAHVLGLYHEQSRPDRDLYVSIRWDNVNPVNAFNFDKYTEEDVDMLMTTYDYGSVMHYAQNAFAINSSINTITPIQNTSAVIGQRVQLSPTDILEIQRYYGCLPTPGAPMTTTATTRITTTTTMTTTNRITTTAAMTATNRITTTATMTTTTLTNKITTSFNASQKSYVIYFISLISMIHFIHNIH